ncbi:MAG: hypothetical protein M3R02_00750 [Chloroflexota bacterium]|nr:hypothetical protein [Chloroflexota bacterium]
MVEPSRGPVGAAHSESRESPESVQVPRPVADPGDDRPQRAPAPDGPTDRRRKRGGASERRQGAGFGDDVERAFCAHFRQATPQTFPVQHRQNLATKKVLVVARRDAMMLYCDGVHPGDHAWPDGSAVDPEAIGV